MRRVGVAFFGALALLASGCAGSVASRYALRLEPLFASAEKRGATVSALVVDADSGEVLYSQRPDTRLVPASTLKLVATDMALARLGPDFYFETGVRLHGEQTGAIFRGRLLIEPSGDPSFGSPRFMSTRPEAVCDLIAKAARERGVGEFRGEIALATPPPPADQALGPGWSWEDAGEAFSAPPAGFVFAENAALVRVKKSAAGALSVEPDSLPPGWQVSVVREPRSREQGLDCARVFGAREVRCMWRAAAASDEASAWVSVDDPLPLFTRCVADAMTRAGIRVELGPIPPARDAQVVALTSLRSPPLAALVQVTNKDSVNLYAERLARAATVQGRDASFAHVAGAMAERLLVRGVGRDAFEVADACGLSRYNLLTARALVQVLQAGFTAPYAGAFIASLAIMGVDGTLARRGRAREANGGGPAVNTGPGGEARANVFAKTGTLKGQRALAGVALRDRDPRHSAVLFALMLGNHPLAPGEVAWIYDAFARILVAP